MSPPTVGWTRLPLLAGIVALEGLLLVGVSAFYAVEIVVATTGDVGRAVVTAVLALAAGAGLVVVARGLVRGRRWSRSPALVTNLILVPVAIGLLQGGRWYAGVPLLAGAVTVVVLLFSSSVNAALEATDPDDGQR